MRAKFALVVFMAIYCVASLNAAPAPWHKWKSKLDGKVVCAQTSPGSGWIKLKGLYKDVRCEKAVLETGRVVTPVR